MIRKYEESNRPEFVSVNSEQEQQFGTSVSPSQQKDYVYITTEMGQKSVLVDGRVGVIHDFCLKQEFHNIHTIRPYGTVNRISKGNNQSGLLAYSEAGVVE
jgi:hypothetical protein